jgi:hypothetical protein
MWLISQQIQICIYSICENCGCWLSINGSSHLFLTQRISIMHLSCISVQLLSRMV